MLQTFSKIPLHLGQIRFGGVAGGSRRSQPLVGELEISRTHATVQHSDFLAAQAAVVQVLLTEPQPTVRRFLLLKYGQTVFEVQSGLSVYSVMCWAPMLDESPPPSSFPSRTLEKEANALLSRQLRAAFVIHLFPGVIDQRLTSRR